MSMGEQYRILSKCVSLTEVTAVKANGSPMDCHLHWQISSAYYGRFCFNDVMLFFLFSEIRESFSKFWSLLDAVRGFHWNQKDFVSHRKHDLALAPLISLLWVELEGFYHTNACKTRGCSHTWGWHSYMVSSQCNPAVWRIHWFFFSFLLYAPWGWGEVELQC